MCRYLTIVICSVYCTVAMTHADVHKDIIICDTIARIYAREQQYNATHICLYHGTSKQAYTAMLANTYLDHIYNGTPLHSNFIKLRTDQDMYHGDASLHEYV